MDIGAALEWLDSHINLEASAAVAGRVEGLSLRRMQALCEVLGDPQHAQPVLHLTGTNGKGSTARILSAVLSAHGISTGTYSSPHLERINERIVRDGEPISDDELAGQFSDLASLEELVPERPSYFELVTAAAFRWFAEVAVDAAVVEVGLLGRWDATNVADGRVAVLTNVERDHTDGAPGWRRAVAEEKAGIVKQGSVFVLGETAPDLRDVFSGTPADELLVSGEDFAREADRVAVGGRVLDLRTPRGRYRDLFLPVHGAHQARNATLAVVAAESFLGRALDPGVLQDGFAAVQLPGRCEVVHRSPLVILDGAHNAAGARALAETLATELVVGGATVLVLGVLGGREPGELLDALGVGEGTTVVVCEPPSPRAFPGEDLARLVTERGGRATVAQSVDHAVRLAVDAAGPDDAVVVAGSLYTVGAARRACRQMGLM